MNPVEDLAGRRFGARLVLRRGANAEHRTRWWVRCGCGTEDLVRSDALKARTADTCAACRNAKPRPGGA